jgi:diphthamide synthase (EF-2-diphthine--ammonia ligase)
MKIAIWVAGKQNAQALLSWAAEKQHAVACLLSMEPGDHQLVWATANIDELKKTADSNKIDLLFKTVKKTGEENFAALDLLLKFAKEKYAIEGVLVTSLPEVAHAVRNAAKKFGIKTVLLPKA